MDYVNLGASGLKVSRIALGMMTFGTPQWRPWVLGEDEARPIVRRAVELGINVFDTANMYSAGVSEEITGRLVREYAVRDEVVVATKLFFPVEMGFKGQNSPGPKPTARPNRQGLSRKHIFAAVDASLERLGLDWIDLYQIHRFDPETPVEETMEALHDVVKAGKVRYIGASSMWAWQFAKMQQVAREHGWTPFVSMQNHYNLLYREEEREMIPLCLDQGVGLLPWSPLARGFLAGNRGARRQERRSDVARADRRDRAAFLLPGQRLRGGRCAEEGRRSARRVDGARRVRVAARPPRRDRADRRRKQGVATGGSGRRGGLALSADEVKALEDAYRPHPVLGHA